MAQRPSAMEGEQAKTSGCASGETTDDKGAPPTAPAQGTFRAPPPSDAGEVDGSNVTPAPYTVLGTEVLTGE